MSKKKGKSYLVRLEDVIKIYDEWSPKGVSNTKIWELYIYPIYGMAERTFYRYLKNAGRLDELPEDASILLNKPEQLKIFEEEN